MVLIHRGLYGRAAELTKSVDPLIEPGMGSTRPYLLSKTLANSSPVHHNDGSETFYGALGEARITYPDFCFVGDPTRILDQ